MALAAIVASRKRNESMIEPEDSDPLMENLIDHLPPKDHWELEEILGILLVGQVFIFSYVSVIPLQADFSYH